ncbi:hypothetical protein EAE96_010306 [Botrytis aclada]|nr:hypothetical protein EAE96_010306 [Botrytis aclada]
MASPKFHGYDLVNGQETEKFISTRHASKIKKAGLVLLIICSIIFVWSLGYATGTGAFIKTFSESTNKFEVEWGPHTFKYNRSFSEAPSPHTDRAWREIFPAKGGFFVHPVIAPQRSTFSVFHQLHCVDGIRGAYWANRHAAVNGLQLQDEDLPMDLSPSHIRHCIDLLRQTLMCHADTTLEAVDTKINGVHGFRTEHQCGNWEQLVDWASEQQLKKPVEQIV